jgi:multimeric flavodoxin WrbA
MNLLIHDLNNEEWNKISDRYDGWEVISDNGTIKSCVGCFGCWVKQPGQCVIKDGYDQMGKLIHSADKVVVISRYTYGGFSSFVKNVFDRSIGWVLPYFEVVDNEMHHKRRYPEDKSFTFIFRGNNLTEEDKIMAQKYVEAAARNLRATVSDVIFEEDTIQTLTTDDHNYNTRVSDELNSASRAAKLILLNCSLRGDKANSKRLLNALAQNISSETELINLSKYLNNPEDLISILLSAEKIVFGMPLYVDGIPSAPLRIMEKMEQLNTVSKKIYVVANMGLYESNQLSNLLSMIKCWCDKCGYEYCGGLAVGAGEMITNMVNVKNPEKGMARNTGRGMIRLADAIDRSESIEDIYANPYKCSRSAYIFMANMSWPLHARSLGVKKKELLRQL